MSYLLFVDESGHDHKAAPYEVTGGIALHVSRLWQLVQELQRLEFQAFGVRLSEYRTELKGSKLLERRRFKWARQGARMDDAARQKHCRAFLTKGLEHKTPTRDEFTAFGQSSLEMARGVFEILRQLEAVLFASAISASVKKPATFAAEEFLRKDHVFLLERFFYFLESKQEHGVLVLDAVDRGSDRRFIRRLERYFSKTLTGRYRAAWIVPVPLFVSSELTYAVQAADLLIYAVKLGVSDPGYRDERHDKAGNRRGVRTVDAAAPVPRPRLPGGPSLRVVRRVLCLGSLRRWAEKGKEAKPMKLPAEASRPTTEPPRTLCHTSPTRCQGAELLTATIRDVGQPEPSCVHP
jgi:hypothetical protein